MEDHNVLLNQMPEQETFDDFILKIKKKVIDSDKNDQWKNRKWLEAYVDSYGSKSHRVSLSVLEGSPPRVILVANHDYKTIKVIIADKVKGYSWISYEE